MIVKARHCTSDRIPTKPVFGQDAISNHIVCTGGFVRRLSSNLVLHIAQINTDWLRLFFDLSGTQPQKPLTLHLLASHCWYLVSPDVMTM